MKLNLNLLGLLFVTCLLIVSCGKDEEDNSGPNVDCGDYTCTNGGTCEDGACECLEGYEGNSCETRLEPTNVRLTGVLVKDFPLTDASGMAWDSDGKVDLIFSIHKGTQPLYTHTTVIQEANPNDDHNFTVSTVTFDDPTANYIIKLLDSDGSDADEISSYTFKPTLSEGTGGVLNLTGGSSQIDLTLKYVY